jgi:ATP-binding cassette subfamily B protein
MSMRPFRWPEVDRPLTRAFALVRPQRRLLLTAAALLTVWTAAILAGPLIVRFAVDHGLKPNDGTVLVIATAVYAGVAVAAYVLNRLQIYTLSRLGETFLRTLRERAFEQLQSLSLGFYDRVRAGVLVARLTADVDALSEFFQYGLLLLVTNALVLGATLAILFVLEPLLALTLMAVLPPLLALTLWYRTGSQRAYLGIREQVGQTLSTVQEGLAGVRVIHAFEGQRAAVARFDETNRRLFDARIAAVKVGLRYFPVIDVFTISLVALSVGVGGWFVETGRTTVGTVAAFVLYVVAISGPITGAAWLIDLVQSARAALGKIFSFLDVEAEVVEDRGARELPPAGDVELAGVSFGYDGPLVLREVELRVAAGERVVLVGPTGAGKSTVAKLIARLYDPTVGAVSLGGVDLRQATLRSTRERIAVVPQEGFLFNGTIRENVRLARPQATDGDVERALAQLGALERLAGRVGGLDSPVSARGSALSAGEKQLVSLARIALADPAVLVLDEATSNLDPGSERLVEEALDRLAEGRTTIVIAHRLSTAARADRVVVVAEGRIVEEGGHDELVARGGYYAALYRSWLASAA